MFENPIEFPSAGYTGYIFNDHAYRSLNVAPYYYISVKTIDGLWGADISTETHPIPNSDGEKSGDTFRRGQTITLSGQIDARGLAELRIAQWFLKEAFWDTDMRKLKFQPWHLNFVLYIPCRVVQDVAMTEQVDSYNFRAKWTVALRADDARTRKFSDDTVYPTWQS